MIRNVILLESSEERVKSSDIAKEIKKSLNTCKLTRFTGESCDIFYSYFFLNDTDIEDLTFKDWSEIYNILLNDRTFTDNLCYFIAIYNPTEYKSLFHSLFLTATIETNNEKNKVRYLSDAKALFSFIQTSLDSVGNTIKAQINDPMNLKFINVIYTTLTMYIMKLDHMITEEVDNKRTTKNITIETNIDMPLEEDAKYILSLLENSESWISNYESNIMNESIINTAVEKAKELNLARQKAERAFDDFVTKKFNELKETRKSRKQAEIVGESLRINREIKRLIAAGVIGKLNIAAGIIAWIVSVMIDKATDKKDREEMVEQIKDELEITDEKIAIADRKGDDKAKIELMRFKQKLNKEYRRIRHVWFNPQTGNTQY